MADQETMKSLQDLQTSYQQKQLQFGQLKVQKLLVQQQFDAIEKQEEQIEVDKNVISARVLLEEKSPYLNSFIINSGSNRNIKNGLAVLDGKNFIGRIVDVNFFSSRVLLITDLNSKIPVIVEPSGYHAILSGRGTDEPTLEYLPENHTIQSGNKVYTSGKEGIFDPGIPIGESQIKEEKIYIKLFSDTSQVMFVNINLKDKEK